MKIIDEFIKFLEQFETDPPSDEDTDNPPSDDEDKDENPPLVNPDSNTGVKIYPLLIKNLKSLSLILSQ